MLSGTSHNYFVLNGRLIRRSLSCWRQSLGSENSWILLEFFLQLMESTCLKEVTQVVTGELGFKPSLTICLLLPELLSQIPQACLGLRKGIHWLMILRLTEVQNEDLSPVCFLLESTVLWWLSFISLWGSLAMPSPSWLFSFLLTLAYSCIAFSNFRLPVAPHHKACSNED